MAKNTLHLAEGLDLPIEAVTEKLAFLGRSGSGKTFAAGRFAEEMLRHGVQVIVLDPIGSWWGLRVGANGKPSGLNIPVFGGLQGDVPLDAKAGALVANLIVSKGCCAVLDVSQFRKGQRKEFVTDFAEEFFFRKKAKRSPVHLLIEESQVFVPQRVQKGEERLLGAMEDIVKLGRNYGIGSSLISQRPQAVNKDCLNQAEILIVLQTAGKHERKAINDWVDEKEIGARVDLAAIKELPVGTAFVWSPQLLRILGKYQIARKTTLDVSATPKFGDKPVTAPPLTPVELDAVRSAMAAVVERTEQEDPAKLRRRIVELERELTRRPTASGEAKTVRVPFIPPHVLAEVRRAAHQAEQMPPRLVELGDQVDALRRTIEAVTKLVTATPVLPVGVPPGPVIVSPPARLVAARTMPPAVSTPTNGERKLGKGPLNILAGLLALYPKPLSQRQVATLAVLSPKTGTFRNYLSELRTAGFISTEGQTVQLTGAGAAYISRIHPKLDAPDLQTLWASRISGTAAKMLKHLLEQYPSGYSREALAHAVGVSSETGTFRNYLSELRSNGLAVTSGTTVTASQTFFLA